ncbi:MAG: hypothetical protein U1A23_04195 [Candidatus Sungbacteria bacterium]|nr:hypothetical protein [Candidatus Sungbacteria bacterium]
MTNPLTPEQAHEKVQELINLIENWIDTDMVKATETYKHWQHDKGSFVYGYIMGLKAAREKLYILREETWG